LPNASGALLLIGSTTSARQQPAALRHFNPTYVWSGNAAQERGEVATCADQNLLPDQKKVSVTDIGITHKDIHEARIIRDAEVNDPDSRAIARNGAPMRSNGMGMGRSRRPPTGITGESAKKTPRRGDAG